jgi:hypothetical protein
MNGRFCPRCQGAPLKGWYELTAEERLVASQRPSPDDDSLDHRRKNHCWCVRCWLEWCESDGTQTA